VTGGPPAPWGAITDVPGVGLGHAQRAGDGWLSGVSVVLPPPGSIGAVDVRGGGPATRETDALDPSTLVSGVHAVVLTGGSAYGLASADGVQRWCEQHGRGFGVGPPGDRSRLVVPIVPAAAIFDLGRGGDPAARPDAALGHAATQAAAESADGAGGRVPARGCVGAGTGALIAWRGLKGGVGTASVRLEAGDLVVGAVAVVNALGTPLDPATGALLATAFVPAGLARPNVPDPDEHRAAAAAAPTASRIGVPGAHTTLAVVATNAAIDVARARRTAIAAHDGLARALWPAHSLLDGDAVFVLATGRQPVEEAAQVALDAAAADAVMLAVLDAVLSATATTTPALEVPAYRDLYPSAYPSAAV
jgi:putative pantetheine hydrolase